MAANVSGFPPAHWAETIVCFVARFEQFFTGPYLAARKLRLSRKSLWATMLDKRLFRAYSTGVALYRQ